ncbi:MAG: dihydroorotate dehydrogenase electron transfer subunit [Planctomycetota bacterium]
MHVLDVPLTFLRDLGGDSLLVGFSCPPVAKDALPGQFIQLRFRSSRSLLLPRAFSVLAARDYCSRSAEADLEILVQVVGEGTRLLARSRPGDRFQIAGPTGNAFEVPEKTKRLIAVAGGVGVAPLYFLAAHLARTRKDVAVLFLYGGASAEKLPARDLVAALPVESLCCTEDGSLGRPGLVTEALVDVLRSVVRSETLVCACGPSGMLRAVQEIVRKGRVRCLLSLENYMACGMGVCQGCVVNVGASDDPVYERVCRDGPVFDARGVHVVELPGRNPSRPNTSRETK